MDEPDPTPQLTVLDEYTGGPRAESGPMQFGNDWPGVFIRGDQSLHFGMTLRAHIAKTWPSYDMTDEGEPAGRAVITDDPIAHFTRNILMGLADTLMSCDASNWWDKDKKTA